MKNLNFLLAIFLIITINKIYSQTNDNPFIDEILKKIKVPATPEAEAFLKYGNTPVNLFTGKPNIDIPIFTIEGRSMNIPISLSYDASGVKVTQLANNAGLGWNLNAGGRITRITNGKVDGYYEFPALGGGKYKTIYDSNTDLTGTNSGLSVVELINKYKDTNISSYFNTKAEAEDFLLFLYELKEGNIDTQPDIYSFNVMGLSEHFIFDPENGYFRSLDNPRTKVETTLYNANGYKYIQDWKITTDDGTKYYFQEAEWTESFVETNNDEIEHTKYPSSWVLTKIETVNNKDVYEFNYTNYTTQAMNEPVISYLTATSIMSPYFSFATTETDVYINYYNSNLLLQNIYHNGDEVVEIQYKSRNDYYRDTALDKIIFKNNSGNIRQVKFNHSYFKNGSSTDPSDPANMFKVRLKLDEIVFKDGNGNEVEKKYSFEYESPNGIASRTSYSQDFLGLYNGKNNYVLYSKLTDSQGNLILDGADRSPNFNYAQKGLLKKIIYPTGGSTVFTYEPNTTPIRGEDLYGPPQEITYGSVSFNGEDMGGSCNTCLYDVEAQCPRIEYDTFYVQEPGFYKLTYNEGGGGNGEAYFFKKDHPTLITYDDMVTNCSYNTNFIWMNTQGITSSNYYLSEGYYQITAIKGAPFDSSTSSFISVKISKFVQDKTTIGTGSVSRAGIRIKSIEDYASDSTLARKREFKYTLGFNETTSSGKILKLYPKYYAKQEPYYVTNGSPSSYSTNLAAYISPPFSLTQPLPEGDGVYTFDLVTRESQFDLGDTPYIGYPKVYEIIHSVSDNDIQVIEHSFFEGNGFYGVHNYWHQGTQLNAYNKNNRNGKEIETKYFEDTSNLKATNIKEYDDNQTFLIKTPYVYTNSNRKLYFVDIVNDNTNGFQIVYRYMNLNNYANPIPPDCSNNCLGNYKLSVLAPIKFQSRGSYGSLIKEINTEHFSTGDIVTKTEYTYEPSIDYLLREKKFFGSNENIITTFAYPKDGVTPLESKFIQRNWLNEILEQKVYKNTIAPANQISFTKKTYSIFPPSQKLLINKIQTAKGSNNLSDRLAINYYDDKANPLEISKEGVSNIYYVWGYNQTKIIAQITNLTRDEAVNNYSGLIGAAITASNDDDINSSNEDALRTALDNLRAGLPENTQMTSYTYDPLIGVTSITDAKGDTQYYIYDDFNRLWLIKDKDGNILKEFEYHYKE